MIKPLIDVSQKNTPDYYNILIQYKITIRLRNMIRKLYNDNMLDG